MKKCNCCKELKEDIEFSINRATLDGLSNKCKKCYNDIRTEKRNKEKLLNPKVINDEPITHKICKGCNEMLHLSRFGASSITKDGREGACRVCRSEKRKKNALNAIEKTEKSCSKCKNTLDISLFSKDVSRDDGYSAICKNCKSKTYEEYMKDPISKERARKRTATWKEENPDKIREYYQKVKKELIPQVIKYHNSLDGRHVTIKSQAKQRKIEYELTKDFVNQFWDANCHYCGEQLDIPRFDRLDSSKGYTEINVVPCCINCNYGKTTMTEQEFLKHCAKIIEHSGDRITDE